MSVTLVESNDDGFSIKLDFKYVNSMLQGEQEILETLNDAGSLATGKLLEHFDTDGSPIKKGDQSFTSKGKLEKTYQTPFGPTKIQRNVHQSNSGGKTYCPLEEVARIVITSTPRFAQVISSKYSQMAVTAVKKDLKNNHGRDIQKKLIQDVSEAVGSLILAKEEKWEYDIPNFKEKVEGISVGLDGTCVLMKDEGWREAMAGTISFYNKNGDKIHTRYIAAPPEYGKGNFIKKLEKEIMKSRDKFPNVFMLGLADGANDNWTFLKKHTGDQLLDFYHASEYVGSVGRLIVPSDSEDWIEKRCHRLKHKVGGVSRIVNEFKNIIKDTRNKQDRATVQKAITYFKNNRSRMSYHKYVDTILPIGSGATEAACKVIVKQRMCKSGMRWKNEGAEIILATRSLHETVGNWGQFWSKVDRYGFNIS